MDESTKLYVFSKKEVALIFAFMFLIALTSFIFGVKVGKSYSFEKAGYSATDRQVVDLMSEEEENVEDIVQEAPAESEKGFEKDVNNLLEETIKSDVKETKTIDDAEQSGNQMVEPAPGTFVPDQSSTNTIDVKKIEDDVRNAVSGSMKVDSRRLGKFYIQLAAYRSEAEAKDFAEAFIGRGYSPDITLAELNDGTWYRVSLGLFDTENQARNYIKSEESLFQGQEYIIKRF